MNQQSPFRQTEPPVPRLPRVIRCFIIVLSVLGFFLVLLFTSHGGVGVSPDSGNYVAAAISLHQGKGYVGVDGAPFVLWPPLFPTLLSSSQWLGLSPYAFARYLNAFLFSTAIFVSSQWLVRHIHSTALRLLGVGYLLLSPLQDVSVFVWSEPLFIVLLLFSLFQAARFISTQSPSSLVYFGALTALACLTRYTGVTIIICGVALVLAGSRATFKGRLGQAALYSFLAASPLALWLLRNYLLTATVAGARWPSWRPLPMNINSVINELGTVFVPYRLPSLVTILGFVVMVLAMSALPIVLTCMYRCRHYEERGVSAIIGPLAVFIPIYLAFLVVAATRTGMDAIDQRLLSPVYPPLMLIIICALDYVWRRLLSSPQVHRKRGIISTVLLVLWLSYPLWQTIQRIREYRSDGVGGFAQAEWQNRPILDYLKLSPPVGRIFSNKPTAIYIATQLPVASASRLATIQNHMQLSDPARNSGAYLVWFRDKHIPQPYEYRLEEIELACDLAVVTCEEGDCIYRLSQKPERTEIEILSNPCALNELHSCHQWLSPGGLK